MERQGFSLLDHFRMAIKDGDIRLPAAKITDEFEHQYRSYLANDIKPNASNEEILERYPDATSFESLQAAHTIDLAIKEKMEAWPPMRLEEATADVFDKTPSDVVAILPNSYRNNALMILDYDAQPLVDNLIEIRIKIEKGYTIEEMDALHAIRKTIDHSRAIGFSENFINWSRQTAQQLNENIDQFLQDNPLIYEDCTAWQNDPNSIPQERKIEIIQNIHNLHAETYGYLPIKNKNILVDKDITDAAKAKGGYEKALDRMYFSPNQIDEKPFSEIVEIALHESDHAYFNRVTQGYISFDPGSPQEEYTIRTSSYDTSTQLFRQSTTFQHEQTEFLIKNMVPSEMAAYLNYYPRNNGNNQIVIEDINEGLNSSAEQSTQQNQKLRDSIDYQSGLLPETP